MEQLILIQHMDKYFAHPERSPERTKIADEVASILRNISSHWSSRSVRLWFNNNKNSTFCQSANFSNLNLQRDDQKKETAQVQQPAEELKEETKEEIKQLEKTQKIPSISDIDSLLPQKDRIFPNEHLPFLNLPMTKK